MILLAVVLCIYLLFFRPFIKERYPLFYAYILLSCCFEILLPNIKVDPTASLPPWIIAYQIIYLFQIYLLTNLWREVLQRDYPSLRLVVYIAMVLASVMTLTWSAHARPFNNLSSALESAVVLNALAAPTFFYALLLVITFKDFRIPVPRHLRGIIYGLTLLTGFDFVAIFVSDTADFVAGYQRLYPWIMSLVIYCKYMASSDDYKVSADHRPMLTMNAQLRALDQRVFYGFMVKTRLYNPATQTYYYRFCSANSLQSSSALVSHAHFEKLYRQHRYRWAGLYYRLIDPLILGSLQPTNMVPKALGTTALAFVLVVLVILFVLLKLSTQLL